MLKRFNTFASLVYGLIVVGCGHPTTTTFEFMPGMMDTTVEKAQELPMRHPPVGTVPRGFTPYPYAMDEGDAAAAQQNPLPHTKDHFVRGDEVFQTYCAVCHGPTGLGDGSIVPKFPRPPSLHSDKVRDWSDGRIYHVITTGQNLMPSYAAKIRPTDRWAVIHYMRALQRAEHPTKEDVELFQQELRK